MYEIYVAARFEAAHRLVGDFGPATRLHGHTYRLEVLVRGERLDGSGVLFDIGELRGAVDELAAGLHYRNLDDVPGLEGRNTTAEVVADHAWEKLAPGLRGRGLDSLLVRVWESPDVYAAREDAL
ncbi:6-carboxytetrahydropterin synthase [Rubrobacter taiwanensis]|uniref:6-carboxy-5,6,7,8-tetrahydropterin synthase n=1 Tax=Rubrobacter taiwanensis TaxID=185139 RepID=A0A4R1BR78_9ACTN|nr:6-carboxytetrahydropterin synthase [Rubrobacter taiwanensis]TCJ20263.1 6-carboxytetrahydropterin synthase [Rubrobacter taiwanensis]